MKWGTVKIRFIASKLGTVPGSRQEQWCISQKLQTMELALCIGTGRLLWVQPVASDLHCSLLSVQRFNVAVTRARSLLIIVGNPHLLECDPNWKELVNFTQKLGSYKGCKYMPRHGTELKWVEEVVGRLENLCED